VFYVAFSRGWFLGASFPFPEVFPRSLAFLAVTNVILALTNLLPIYRSTAGAFRALVHMIFRRCA
jgi:hypothetical protein